MNMDPANRCTGSGLSTTAIIERSGVCPRCFRTVRIRVDATFYQHSRYDHAPRRTEGRP